MTKKMLVPSCGPPRGILADGLLVLYSISRVCRVVQCLKILEEARPVFKIGADMRSAVLKDVIDLMGIKYRHIVSLSTICRAWVQCING